MDACPLSGGHRGSTSSASSTRRHRNDLLRSSPLTSALLPLLARQALSSPLPLRLDSPYLTTPRQLVLLPNISTPKTRWLQDSDVPRCSFSRLHSLLFSLLTLYKSLLLFFFSASCRRLSSFSSSCRAVPPPPSHQRLDSNRLESKESIPNPIRRCETTCSVPHHLETDRATAALVWFDSLGHAGSRSSCVAPPSPRLWALAELPIALKPLSLFSPFTRGPRRRRCRTQRQNHVKILIATSSAATPS